MYQYEKCPVTTKEVQITQISTARIERCMHTKIYYHHQHNIHCNNKQNVITWSNKLYLNELYLGMGPSETTQP